MTTCATTCPYCGVGCGVSVESRRGNIITVEGDTTHPANAGRLCVKGTALAETLGDEGRLHFPLYRGQPLGWDDALDLVAARLRDTRAQYGPEAVAFYLSGQLLTEDYYVANKLLKGFLGSANVDTNSRLCMSSAVAAYKRAFGADLVPCSYADLEDCELLVMVGSNAAWTHPVIYQRIAASKRHNPRKRIVVIDPRRTDTCDIADLHLQLAPGSDGLLFAGLLRYLHRGGHADTAWVEAHTTGLEEALAAVTDLDPERVARATGLSVADLERFYGWFAGTPQTVTLYSQGVNQSATGTDKCNAIINCHLATGRVGRPGAGPFSITGQPNAMGGREVGGLANQLAAHMDFEPAAIDRVRRFWDAPDMATGPGLKAVDMFRAAAEGQVRFLWIMATNPAVSLPEADLVRRALQRCEFVVVSDCTAETDTAALADLVLPAAGWGEKDGTVTNSERCISRQRRLVAPPGQARPDWWMVAAVARRLGFGRQFPYTGPAEIFREHAALSAFENDGSRAFDIGGLAGLTDEQYGALAPTLWPLGAGTPPPGPLADGRFYTPDRRARFLPVAPPSPAVAGDGLLLNTGRLRDQWHTMTRTGRVPRLMRHRDYFGICMHPEDAASRGLAEGGLVEVHNEFGRIRGVVQYDPGLPRGQLFCPIHWSDRFSGSACVGRLIPGITDPVSGQPQYKATPVRVSPLVAGCWGALFTREVPILPELLYWSRVRLDGGYLTLLAGAPAPPDPASLRGELLSRLPAADHRLEYSDTAAEDFRDIGVAGDRLLYALFLNPRRNRLPAHEWLVALGAVSPEAGHCALLVGGDPGGSDAGRLVCTCWEVGERQIETAIAQGADTTERLGQVLRCGTQCGSCLPELRRCLAQAQRDCAA